MTRYCKTHRLKILQWFQKSKTCLCAIVLTITLIIIPKINIQASEYNETRIQLAFILKVLDFVDSFPGDKDQLQLCLYGFSGDEVEFIRQDIDYSKHTKIILHNQPKLQNPRSCNIIFFNKNYVEYKNILDYTKDSSTLAFAEIKYFSDHGGMVEFYKYKGKYKFIINNELAIKKNISFNAKLLEISK
jgi:hypothetical protein